MPSQVFISIIKKRQPIILLFKLLYTVLFLISIFGSWSLLTMNNFVSLVIDLGYWFGKIAVLVYILTLVPGIFRRFQIKTEFSSLLMVFRRYIGILVYFFVLPHMLFLFAIDLIYSGFNYFKPQLFIAFGIIAESLLFLLTITSNDIATKRLGVWWSRLHSVTYCIVWFIFLHIALVKLSVWSVIIGSTGLLVVISHLYAKFKK